MSTTSGHAVYPRKGVAEKLRAEARESASVFAEKAYQLGLKGEVSLRTVALPSGPSTPERLAESRKCKLKAHLERVFAQATSNEPVRAETSLKTEPVSLQSSASALASVACRLCQGGCCTQAGDQAYLSAASIRRVLQEQAEAEPSALMARYLQAIPERSERGSCIYHTESGCNLPGGLRAKLCHQYYCEPLNELLQTATGRQPRTLLALTRRQDDHHSDHLGLPNEITQVAVFNRGPDGTWRRED